MSFKMQATTDKEFEQPPVGSFLGLLYRMVDIGSHANPFDKEQPARRQLVLSFEIDEAMGNGQRFSINAFRTLSLHPKANLRKDLESWRGAPIHEGDTFDLGKVLGKTALLSLKENQGGKTIIGSISKPMKGAEPLEAENPLVAFDLDDPDWDVFNELPEWLQTKITASPEYARSRSGSDATTALDEGEPTTAPDDFDDDIPF